MRDLDDGTTEVTETFDWSTARCPWGIELLGLPRRNLDGMVETLRRLDKLLSTRP